MDSAVSKRVSAVRVGNHSAVHTKNALLCRLECKRETSLGKGIQGSEGKNTFVQAPWPRRLIK